MPVLKKIKNNHEIIIICADNDHTTTDNPGLKKAVAAASKFKLQIVYPVDIAGSDFNDMMIEQGINSVRERIAKPEAPGSIKVLEVKEKPDKAPGKKKDVSIIIRGGNLPEEVETCQEVMRQAGDIFERGGELFRAVPVKNVPSQKIKRSPNSMILQKISSKWLKLYLSGKVGFSRIYKGNFESCNCPLEISDSICANAGDWNLPYLTGLLECPTVTPDGRIIKDKGYDAETGLLLIDDLDINVEDKPAKEDIEQAMATVHDIISEYEFETKVDYAVAFSAILTSVTRRVLPTSPFFAIDATKAGSGKTKFAECLSTVGTGRNPTLLNIPPNEPKEEEKRYDSVLIAGDSVILVDNVEHTVKSDRLCSIGTQESVGARLLGFSKFLTLPSNSMWIFTGNNIQFAGDITRRVLKTRINTKTENPEEREFEKDCKQYTVDNRKQIVEAVITVLKAYHQADDKPKLSAYGSYEEWSKFIRGACMWLGLADPVEAKRNIQNDDYEKNRLTALLESWYQAFGNEGLTVKQVCDKCGDIKENPKCEGLKDILFAYFPVKKDGSLNSTSIGKFISKNNGTIENGYFFEKCGNFRNTTLWRCQTLTVINDAENASQTHTQQLSEKTDANPPSVGLCGFVRNPVCEGKKNSIPVDNVTGDLSGYEQTHTNPHKQDNILEAQENDSVGLEPDICFNCKSELIEHPETGNSVCPVCHPIKDLAN